MRKCAKGQWTPWILKIEQVKQDSAAGSSGKRDEPERTLQPATVTATVMATRFRNAFWLKTNDFAPQVFLFRNIETGQVIYSQTPHVTKYQIGQQFFRPNKENKKPLPRHDIWRPLAVAQFQNYQNSVQAYHALVELRYLREVKRKKDSQALRKLNEYNRTWCSGQYRPTYTMEATADLSTVIDELKLAENCKIYWDGLWWRGDAKLWNDSVQHEDMERYGRREKFVILDEIRAKGLLDFAKNNPVPHVEEQAQPQVQAQA